MSNTEEISSAPTARPTRRKGTGVIMFMIGLLLAAVGGAYFHLQGGFNGSTNPVASAPASSAPKATATPTPTVQEAEDEPTPNAGCNKAKAKINFKNGSTIDGDKMLPVRITVACLPDNLQLYLVDYSDKFYFVGSPAESKVTDKATIYDGPIGGAGTKAKPVRTTVEIILVAGKPKTCGSPMAAHNGQGFKQLPTACTVLSATYVDAVRDGS